MHVSETLSRNSCHFPKRNQSTAIDFPSTNSLFYGLGIRCLRRFWEHVTVFQPGRLGISSFDFLAFWKSGRFGRDVVMSPCEHAASACKEQARLFFCQLLFTASF
jgi:hypothetical protein